mgnify:CR=1 FL=1
MLELIGTLLIIGLCLAGGVGIIVTALGIGKERNGKGKS